MVNEILNNLLYFLNITVKTEALWAVLPLAIATVVMISYFERYKEERPMWDTYVANSLVLLFVSMTLFRYIYNINGNGAINFLDYSSKSIATVFLLLLGSLILRLNFEHVLPSKIAKYLSSPLTVNILAYAIILFVYSTLEENILFYVSILALVIILLVLLNGIKIPLKIFFKYLNKEKEKERLDNVKEIKFEIGERKKELKFLEKNIKNNKIRELERQKKSAISLKKKLKK